MSVIRSYRGDSVPVAKVVNVTIVAPVVAGQVYSVACNGKPVTYTALTGDGVSQVASGLAAALAAASIPEFKEFLPSASGAVLTLTAATPGVPFEVAVSSSANVAIAETVGGKMAINEEQSIALVGTYTGGTFTLTYTYGTTAAIAYNATAATVQAAIAALAGVGVGQVIVSGGPGPGTAWLVQFTGALAGTAVAAGTINGASLTGNGAVQITHTQPGAGLSNAIQQVDLSAATGGTFSLSFGGQTTSLLNWLTTAAAMQSALQALSTIGSGNCTVYGDPSANGVTAPNHNTYFAVFGGALGGTAVSLITINSNNLTGSTGTTLSVQSGGQTTSSGFQLVDVGYLSIGTFTLTYGANTTGPIAVTPNGTVASFAGAVYNALAALPSPNVLATYAGQFIAGAPGQQVLVKFGSTSPAPVPVLTLNTAGLAIAGGTPAVTVLADGRSNLNDVQQVVIFGGGGTFTLSAGAQTTSAIAYNASTGTLQTRIQTDLAAAFTAVTVTGSGTLAAPWIVTATNPGNTLIAAMTGNGASLTGGGGSITELVHGAAGVNEQQTITLAAGVTGGTFTLSFNGSPASTAIAWNASAGAVQSALTALSTVNTLTVGGSAGGPWTATWSGAQAAAPQPLLFGNGSLLIGATTSLITLATATWSAGPLHYDDPNNWSPVGQPNAGDLVYFAQGNSPCLYGLDQIATFTVNTGTNLATWISGSALQNGQAVYCTSTTALPSPLAANTLYYLINVNRDAKTFQLSTTLNGSAVTLTTTGTGTHTAGARLGYLEFNSINTLAIGSPFENALGYVEYRERYLHVGMQSIANGGTQNIVIGTGDGSGSPKIQLNTDIDPVAVKIINTGGSADPGVNALLWLGSNASSTMNVINGDVGLALYPGEAATLASLTERAGSIHLGSGATIGTIEKTGGTMLIDGATVNGVVTSR